MYNSEGTSDALCIEIDSIEQTYEGCYKITSSDGSVFFVRQFYLTNLNLGDLKIGEVLDGEIAEEIVDSTFAFVAESAAVNYLNRCEHSRYQLTRKLKAKKHSDNAIKQALDFLESENLLSDSRFALSWLRTRRLNHTEGRTKLFGLLLNYGLDSKTANNVLDEYFTEFPEEDSLEKAAEKLIGQGVTKEQFIEKLTKKGFSISDIKKCW